MCSQRYNSTKALIISMIIDDSHQDDAAAVLRESADATEELKAQILLARGILQVCSISIQSTSRMNILKRLRPQARGRCTVLGQRLS
jgi:hypothetical protein